jgi:hypothetical protein
LLELTIVRAGNAAQLSWSADATGFSLETSPRLGPSANWMLVTNPVTQTNGQNQVKVPLTNAASFYRLLKP